MVLYQPINGYCYNSDTHFLYNFILESLKAYKNNSGKLLDIGSGSGILGLLVSRDLEKFELTQCELQEEFQFLSQKNASNNKINAKLIKGDFLDIEFDSDYDCIVSNPPFYHANVVKSENKILKIARYNDFMPLEKFIKKVSMILKNSGKFFFCYDAKQINEIILFSNKYGLNIEAIEFVHPKIDKDASLVMLFLKKNSKSQTKILPPLVVFEDNKFTKRVNEIYEKTQTHSIKVII